LDKELWKKNIKFTNSAGTAQLFNNIDVVTFDTDMGDSAEFHETEKHGDSISLAGNTCVITGGTGAITKVEANPAITTDTLTGITIGDTNYAIGGGSSEHKYFHAISINYNSGETYINIHFINDRSTAYTTITDINSYLRSIGCITTGATYMAYPVSGTRYSSGAA